MTTLLVCAAVMVAELALLVAVMNATRSPKGRRVPTRDQIGCWLANKALTITTPRYRGFIRGSIEYGLRAAADDERTGSPPPPEWRTEGRDHRNPLPKVER